MSPLQYVAANLYWIIIALAGMVSIVKMLDAANQSLDIWEMKAVNPYLMMVTSEVSKARHLCFHLDFKNIPEGN